MVEIKKKLNPHEKQELLNNLVGFVFDPHKPPSYWYFITETNIFYNLLAQEWFYVEGGSNKLLPTSLEEILERTDIKIQDNILFNLDILRRL